MGCHALLQGPSWPRNGTWVSCVLVGSFTTSATLGSQGVAYSCINKVLQQRQCLWSIAIETLSGLQSQLSQLVSEAAGSGKGVQVHCDALGYSSAPHYFTAVIIGSYFFCLITPLFQSSCFLTSFLYFFFNFLLKDNCFIEFCCFLSDRNMNQP